MEKKKKKTNSDGLQDRQRGNKKQHQGARHRELEKGRGGK